MQVKQALAGEADMSGPCDCLKGSHANSSAGSVNKTRALCKTLSMHNTTVSFFQWRIGCSNVSAFRFDKRAQI